jgi:phage/plasmid primase-like uncharacterized protein
MRVDAPKGSNPAVLEVIDFLGGDRSTGMCFCPCHDDGANPSLQVRNGDRVPVVLHCFGVGTKEHDLEVIAYLKANKKWPTSSALSRDQSSSQAEKARSLKDRRRYALKIWKELRRLQRHRDLRHLLGDYLQRRGIEKVPETALAVVPMEYPEAEVAAHDPGMVLPVRDKEGKFQGMHVIWLNADMTAKREDEPQRQSFGLIKGNFIQLTKIDWDNPPPKLIIAEGPETALAMAQLTGLPAIATGGKGFVADVEPPRCSEYIIGVDNDEDGGSRKAAGELAQRLVGCVVRITMPDKPEGGKNGYDWNDALIDAGADEGKLAKLARSITEAPSFEAVMTEVEKREERINALAALKAEDHLAYEQERQKAANSLKIRVSVLDEEVDRRVGLLQAQRQAAPPPPVDMELLAASACEIIASEDVLALFATEIGRFIVGEEKNSKILYLVCTSRLFNKTMHAAVKGPSSGGKSESRDRVVDFFPREHVIEFTALSEKALLYMEEGFEHKILSMGEAMSPEEAKFQDYLLRELMSKGKLRYPVAQKVGDKIVTIMIEKDGPVSFLVTTTRNKLNPENETRMLSLEVNDTEEQTKAVIGKVAEVVGLNKEMDIDDLRPWHDYQRLLAAGECRVIVPYARTLARLIKETKTVRLRRDFSQLLIAIKTLALLHRDHRKRSRKGEIVATIKGDYAAARDLMADLLATASEIKMRETIEVTIAAVRLVAERPDPDIDGATVRQVANELGLDRSAVHRRLKAAESEGHIVNLENRKGYPARYKPTPDGGGALMDRERPGELLPTPGALRRAYQAERAAKR